MNNQNLETVTVILETLDRRRFTGNRMAVVDTVLARIGHDASDETIEARTLEVLKKHDLQKLVKDFRLAN